MSSAATELSTEIIPFTAGDGMALNMHRVRGKKDPWRGPVILVHGAGVRANIFRAPEHETVVDALVAAGWDVWLENWRASIDVEKNLWNLDQAAVYDHPHAVDTIVEATGAASVKAVIH
jgi:poly(3-hydroxyalkanoate) synthetase